MGGVHSSAGLSQLLAAAELDPVSKQLEHCQMVSLTEALHSYYVRQALNKKNAIVATKKYITLLMYYSLIGNLGK